MGNNLRMKKTDEIHYTKIRNFVFSKDATEKMKKQTMLWERIFGTHICDQELSYPEYIKKS